MFQIDLWSFLDEELLKQVQELESAGIPWRTECMDDIKDTIKATFKNSVREAHQNAAEKIKRVALARQGDLHLVHTQNGAIDAMFAGRAYIVGDFANNDDAIDKNDVISTLAAEGLLGEYSTMGGDVDWVLTHSAAPTPHGEQIVMPKSTYRGVRAACLVLGFKTVTFPAMGVAAKILMAPDWRFMIEDAHRRQRMFDDVDAAARDTAEMLKKYVFRMVGDTCVGVRRDLFLKEDAKLSIVSASYPKETMAAIKAGAKYIITDDATWGQIVLGNMVPVSGSPTSECLDKLQAEYHVGPDENPGGVICVRRG